MPQPDPVPAAPTYESFRHVVETARLAAGAPVTAELIMSEADRTALARDFRIPGVEALSGEALAARRAGLIEVEGRVRATLTRQCVASLDDMAEVIDEAFVVTYTEHRPAREEAEAEADLDAPEPIEDGRLDLGQVLLEQLVLAMAPHPRKPGAEAPADPGAGARITPFDVLAGLAANGAANDVPDEDE